MPIPPINFQSITFYVTFGYFRIRYCLSIFGAHASETDEVGSEKCKMGELAAASEETDAQAGCVNEFITELTALSIFLKKPLEKTVLFRRDRYGFRGEL